MNNKQQKTPIPKLGRAIKRKSLPKIIGKLKGRIVSLVGVGAEGPLVDRVLARLICEINSLKIPKSML